MFAPSDKKYNLSFKFTSLFVNSTLVFLNTFKLLYSVLLYFIFLLLDTKFILIFELSADWSNDKTTFPIVAIGGVVQSVPVVLLYPK